MAAALFSGVAAPSVEEGRAKDLLISFCCVGFGFVRTTNMYKEKLQRWRWARDYSKQPQGCFAPSGFGPDGARCKTLLWSRFVEPTGILTPMRNLDS